jgi:DNA-binding NarL/FixJ family response regulator
MTETLSYVTRVEFAVPDAILPPMQALIKKQPAYEIIKPGIASGCEILQEIDKDRPDILILDLTLPRLDVGEVLTTLSDRKIHPHVLVTAPRHDLPRDIQNYQAVRGVLPRNLAVSPVLRHVLAGLVEGCCYFMSLPTSDPALFHLNRAETVLLALIVLGLNSGELMEELGCSINALYTRQTTLRRKLEVDNNLRATSKALKMGLAGTFTGAGERRKTKGAA